MGHGFTPPLPPASYTACLPGSGQARGMERGERPALASLVCAGAGTHTEGPRRGTSARDGTLSVMVHVWAPASVKGPPSMTMRGQELSCSGQAGRSIHRIPWPVWSKVTAEPSRKMIKNLPLGTVRGVVPGGGGSREKQGLRSEPSKWWEVPWLDSVGPLWGRGWAIVGQGLGLGLGLGLAQGPMSRDEILP